VEQRKSVKERYIRVAAIDIIISEGVKNICVAGAHEKYVVAFTSIVKQRHTISNASVIMQDSQHPSFLGRKGRNYH
jgi:hypothetical protein